MAEYEKRNLFCQSCFQPIVVLGLSYDYANIGRVALIPTARDTKFDNWRFNLAKLNNNWFLFELLLSLRSFERMPKRHKFRIFANKYGRFYSFFIYQT